MDHEDRHIRVRCYFASRLVRGGDRQTLNGKNAQPKNIFELIRPLNSTQAQRGIITTRPPEVPSHRGKSPSHTPPPSPVCQGPWGLGLPLPPFQFASRWPNGPLQPQNPQGCAVHVLSEAFLLRRSPLPLVLWCRFRRPRLLSVFLRSTGVPG